MRIRVSRWVLMVLAVVLAVQDNPSAAAELPAPQGEVLLTISGAIGTGGKDGAVRFDRAMLEAMPQTSFATNTIWTSGLQRFEGVALSHLLKLVGASGTTLRAYALNDYHVDIPADDAVPDGPIIALRLNGAPMPRRNKGPLWIVYPYDSKSEYRKEAVYARSIWQLYRIEVLDGD